jgi:predicted transporter
MLPHAEMVHWAFGSGILLVGLCLLCEAIVGPEVWRMRPWRKYLWPGIAFGLGVFLWPVMAFFTNSSIHMYAHGSWAEVLMLAGGAELGLVHGRLRSPLWRLTWPLAFAVTGIAFIVHEQNPWFFARSAFLHHLLGWTFLVGAGIPLALVWRPRSTVLQAGFALTIVIVSVMLFADRDVAPVFGHLSQLAGPQHR